jgi:hypothetical protein
MAGTPPCFASCAKRRAVRGEAWILAAAALLLAFGGCRTAAAFDSGRASFAVRVNEETIPYRVFAVYALPGERLDVAVSDTSPPGRYRMQASRSQAVAAGANRWLWRAPRRPGVSQLRIDSGADAIRLNVVVMHPAVELRDGRLNAYRIGYYPATALRQDPIYLPPRGFIELGEHSGSLQLSPHFQLWQFPAKQAGGPPKYLVLRERLLLKLELLLERLNAEGRNAETFTIMSGYRTPSYNAALGNVEYSRHVYGGAADIFVDSAPRDGIMDDLNRDGVTDYRDAQWLYRLANGLFSAGENRAMLGGLGVYRSTSAHGPFLHVDARGTRARWGLVP